MEIKYEKGDSGSTHVALDADPFTVSIPVITLDKKLSDFGITYFEYLKIDVEGFEPYILIGAKAVIEASPNITIQTAIDFWHLPRYGLTLRDVSEIGLKMGLVPHIVQGNRFLARIDYVDYGDVIWRKE